ncbi:hypothetical protein [Nocardioides sediminis]|uniref:hypothetical protein n=1 Tax=Nocardioides sediminis TaxID=433648 RepID=UPI000D31F0E0|nr:hypothetical protein [Nocardioides sediminis]
MKRIASSAGALALAAVALVGTAGPSSAVTDHCDDYKSPDKVELDHETTTLYFEPYTTVCYKAGTETRTVVVGDSGVLKSEIYNKKGKRMAFSYYIADYDCPPYGGS